MALQASSRLRPGGSYANGNHIHGGGGGNGVFAGDCVAGGGADFRAGVPAFLQSGTAGGGQAGGAGGRGEVGAQGLSWKKFAEENDDAGVEGFADCRWPWDDSRGCEYFAVRPVSGSDVSAGANGADRGGRSSATASGESLAHCAGIGAPGVGTDSAGVQYCCGAERNGRRARQPDQRDSAGNFVSGGAFCCAAGRGRGFV